MLSHVGYLAVHNFLMSPANAVAMHPHKWDPLSLTLAPKDMVDGKFEVLPFARLQGLATRSIEYEGTGMHLVGNAPPAHQLASCHA